MKKKYLAVMMGLVLAAIPAVTYASENQTELTSEVSDDAQESAKEQAEETEGESGAVQETLMGTVTEIAEDSITISLMSGGRNPGGAEQEDGTGSASGEAEQEDGAESASGEAEQEDEAESASEEAEQESKAEDGSVEAAAETRTIALTEETQYYSARGGMGGGMQMPSGDGEMPEQPDGEQPSGDGEMPEMPSGGGEAPEQPDGEQPSGDGEVPEMPSGDGEMPEQPDGEQPSGDGEMPEMPSGGGEVPEQPNGEQPSGGMQSEEITLADIEAGDLVQVTLHEDGSAATVTVMSMNGMGPDSGSEGVESYDAVENPQEDTGIDSESIRSTGADESAVLVDSDATVTLTNDTITRDSDDSTGGDASSFYGVGAAVLGTDGTTIVSGCEIDTDAAGGAGVFAYGDGVVYVMDTAVTTQQDTSGGIHVAGGGTLYAWDVTAVTNGESSAAIRSDRGSGTMVVDGGSYTSNGVGSPAVYCTADISVNNAELTANGSEAVCIEGLNTLRLYDCSLTGNMKDDGQNDTTWTVIVYQSMSGDSEVGNGTFQMSGGTLTSGNGGIFYTTNTECTITLSNVEIVSAEGSEFFLQCTGNNNARGWGQTGSNGSDCLFTAISQDMDGNVIWDSISNLDFYMTEGSVLTGAFVNDETWAGNGGDGSCSVVISEDSSWIVTGDSTVTSLSCSGNITDESGNTVTIVGTDGTVYVEGNSSYTITAGSYSDSADLSVASSADSFDSHAQERPTV